MSTLDLWQFRTRRDRPQLVRRVHIPQPDGRLRPLGIPTVKDRIVQTAVMLVLEPIFEADFQDCSYGFRPGRNAHQALDALKTHLQAGFREVDDADLQGDFDTIPHDQLIPHGQLLKCLRIERLIQWIGDQPEGRFRLTINRKKTRVVKLDQAGESLDFLGFTFRYDRPLLFWVAAIVI